MDNSTREKIIPSKRKFRRDQNLIPTDIAELNKIDKIIRNLPIRKNVRKIK